MPENARSVAEKFIVEVKNILDTWEKADQSDNEKLSGVAFSILATIDGASLSISPFALKPIDGNGIEGADIAGSLHDHFYQNEKITVAEEVFLKGISDIVLILSNQQNLSLREKLTGVADRTLLHIGQSLLGVRYSLRPIDENGKEGEDIAGHLHPLFVKHQNSIDFNFKATVTVNVNSQWKEKFTIGKRVEMAFGTNSRIVDPIYFDPTGEPTANGYQLITTTLIHGLINSIKCAESAKNWSHEEHIKYIHSEIDRLTEYIGEITVGSPKLS